MTSANLSILDFVLLPFYLAIIYAIAYNIRKKYYPPGHPWRKYFLPALTIKVIGAILIGLIYAFYYKGGDTFNYFNFGQVINSALDDSIGKWLNLLFHIPSESNGIYYEYINKIDYYPDPATYSVVSITAFISLFTFNTYLPTAVLFAFISFSGIWALFRTFARLYPHLLKPIAVAALFIPSVFIWGSGIFKDTVCMLALGWLTYSTFRFLVLRDSGVRNIFIGILSFALISVVKLYILLGFIPALGMWVLFNYSQKIRSYGARILVKIFFTALTIVGFLFFMQRFGETLGKYSLEKIAETSQTTGRYLYNISGDEGSSYSLGNFSPTIGGMITLFPAAVNATFFRPYFWESKKIFVLFSAFEAFLFLFLTIKILLKVGPVRVWKTIGQDPTIQFCLIFSIIFAFAVGISSYNFGTLSRYKIPCMPFYAFAMILIYYKNFPLKNKLFSPLNI